MALVNPTTMGQSEPTTMGQSEPPHQREWHVAVNADGAVTAPGSPAGLDGQPGSRAETIQLLTPEGERVEHPDYPLELTTDETKGLYRDLALVRRIDVEATALQRQGELGLWASLLGQEAAQVGSRPGDAPRDFAFPTYREHGVAWCRGVDPPGCWSCSAGSATVAGTRQKHRFHLYTIVIGSQTLHATGYAMGIQRDGAVGEDGEAAIAYFGDGATSQGDVTEAFVWAAVFNAPVVFFCQNNQWAISEPLGAADPIPLYHRARASVSPASGWTATTCSPARRSPGGAATRRASGRAPTLIEAFTYRMGAHTTSDDPTRYRLASRPGGVEAQGPDRAGEGVPGAQQQMADAAFFEEVDPEAEQLGRADARRRAWRCRTRSRSTMFDNVYAEPTALMDAERTRVRHLSGLFAGRPRDEPP